ncbi:ankyrin repeat domain-containing protein [Planctomycetes bacterium TBK1r]|uniref:Ankyrin repeats (3 copies) n=1 Tax=Stieleria magnilauensis TaxID=2527963 RepID=A0ABX5XJK7_9BACT|nr:Ankyrin repeats (3 copies) [Planctomycetes bacterium TBK1r]
MNRSTYLLVVVGIALWFVVGSMFSPSGAELASAEKTTAEAAPREPLAVGHPTFASPHASPIAISGNFVFVVNTPADTVDVIDAEKRKVHTQISVGVDPVGIAVRPDGKEVWVSNHVSDSVSVIDNDPESPTYLHVIATIQEFDLKTKATAFDEPVGIAFAGNEKAYVALSSENQIAVVNVSSRKITKRLRIPAQDPRAIAVRGDRLYVVPFESNNKTQLSGGSRDDIDGQQVTFDAWQHSIAVNNVLSLGHVTDIVKHPDVPDRDLFVFDTKTDKLVESVDTLGTLLYGITVDSKGNVFVAQTDARNDANGRAGTKKHGMKEMENRAFLNQITRVSFTEGSPEEPQRIDLEPLPPGHPEKGMALATPFAIQVSADDTTLVATAAGSDKLFTVDAESGEVLGRIPVGSVPRGIALRNADDGKATQAWVYNAVANTVSVIDVSDAAKPQVAGFVKLDDPTHKQVKLGRTWFNDADASSTGTFSCESCHPDSNTDQLLWVLQTPVVTGGNQIMPRSTMPVRGLRDTAPFHWDGVLGDPYGGNNSANIYSSVDPVADEDDQITGTRHLVDVSMAEILKAQGDGTVNDEGKPGGFTAAERDDLATYLLSIPFPPAQRRAFDNVLTDRAKEGYKLFHIDGDLDPSRTTPNVCGDCHRMPHLVSTNTPGTGMEAPTWRGAYDRFLILPQGRLNIIEFPFYRDVAHRGQSEEEIWRFSWGGRRRFNPVWNMVLEGSTGFSGSFARQITLSKATVDDVLTAQLLDALELSSREGGVVLEVDGVFINDSESKSISLQFDDEHAGGSYVAKPEVSSKRRRRSSSRDRAVYAREELVSFAKEGKFVGTFTGRHGALADVEHPQPALWTLGPIEQQRGHQEFPILHKGKRNMSISGRNFDEHAGVYVDGRRVEGSVTYGDDNENEEVIVELASLPENGLHMLQVQNENGMFSNDFIFHVTADADAAAKLKRTFDEAQVDRSAVLSEAITSGDVDKVNEALDRAQAGFGSSPRVNVRDASGSTPLSAAALLGNIEIVKLLLERGANVAATNRDGTTPLHVAAFMCHTEVVELLLENGASPGRENNRGDSAIDSVSGQWSEGLASFYSGIGRAVGVEVDLDRIQEQRPKIAKLLREHAEQ